MSRVEVRELQGSMGPVRELPPPSLSEDSCESWLGGTASVPSVHSDACSYKGDGMLTSYLDLWRPLFKNGNAI